MTQDNLPLAVIESLVSKDFQPTKIMKLQLAQIISPFDLRDSQKYLTAFYPQFNELLKIENKIYEIDEVIEFGYEKVVKINEQHWTNELKKQYLTSNIGLENQPVFYPNQLIYSSSENKEIIEKIGHIKFLPLIERQVKLKKFVDDHPTVTLAISDFYNPKTFLIKTGNLKRFKARFLGSIVNDIIGQFELQ